MKSHLVPYFRRTVGFGERYKVYEKVIKDYITGVDKSPEGISVVFQILVSLDTTLLD